MIIINQPRPPYYAKSRSPEAQCRNILLTNNVNNNKCTAPLTNKLFSPSGIFSPPHQEKAPEKQQDGGSPAVRALQNPHKSSGLVFEDFEVTEDDHHYYFATDLPGVKSKDITLELKDGIISIYGKRVKRGTATKTYSKKVAVDEQAVDVSRLSARLSEGVLTIIAPRKQNTGPIDVSVMTCEPPEEGPALNLEIDLPGIEAQNLQLVLSGSGELHVSGKRTRGCGRDLEQAYMVNTRLIDASKLEAYLIDGVLFVRAPFKSSLKMTIPIEKDSTKGPLKDKGSSGDNKENRPSCDNITAFKSTDEPLQSKELLNEGDKNGEETNTKTQEALEKQHGEKKKESDMNAAKSNPSSKLSFRRGFLL